MHLMTGPKGNSQFCFPKTFNVSQAKGKGNIKVRTELNVSHGTSQLKTEKKTGKKAFALQQLAHKFAMVSRSMT